MPEHEVGAFMEQVCMSPLRLAQLARALSGECARWCARCSDSCLPVMAVIRIALDWRVCVRVGLQQLLDISNRAHEKEVARVVEKAEMLEEALLVRNDADVLLQVRSAPYKRSREHTACGGHRTPARRSRASRELSRVLSRQWAIASAARRLTLRSVGRFPPNGCSMRCFALLCFALL